MILLSHLIQFPEIYKEEFKKRFLDPEPVDSIIALSDQIKLIQVDLDNLRRQKNEFNENVIHLKDIEKKEAIEKMKPISDKIKNLEESLRESKSLLEKQIYLVPNLSWDKMPVGKDSDSNLVTSVFGSKPDYNFEPKPYYELDIFKRDYLSEKGVEVAGFRGYYIKGNLAKLQKALFDWILKQVQQKGFEYIIAPIMVNEKAMYGTGFFPTGKDDVFEVFEGDKSKYLVGSSEVSLMFLHSNEVLDLSTSKKLTAWTSCFRKEIGAYGKDTKGGIRVHQFDKIETVILCRPEDTEKEFTFLTQVFKQNLEALNLHYHDLETCTGDNSFKNYRMIDIEAWFPASGEYRELASSSICTDYQTRNLNIKCLDSAGKEVVAHSLNCTGITNRTLYAILEQNQQADGTVKIPSPLIEFYGDDFLR
jgi:seryl-tRNA synthetase